MPSHSEEMAEMNAAQPSVLTRLVFEARLAQAREAARRGRYAEAEQLLLSLTLGEKEQPAVLDLRARIYAQQGRIEDAKLCWDQALRHEASNDRIQAGLRWVEGAQGRRHRRWGMFARWGLALLAGALLALGFFSMQGRMRGLEGEMTSLELASRSIEQSLQDQIEPLVLQGKQDSEELRSLQTALQDAQTAMQAQLGEVEQAQEVVLDRLTPLQPPVIEVDVPGVTSRVEPDAVIMTFDEGLFRYGTLLWPESADLLTLLGQQLEPYAGQIKIDVIGFSDDVEGSTYPDPVLLSMLRAVRVINHISASTQLTQSLFKVTLPGDRPAPFSNASVGDRARNRTVMLIISTTGE
jgi:flagellar motor protein MotB